MTKDELVRKISEQTGLTLKDSKKFVEITFDSIAQSLLKGEKVKITGFGTFDTKKRGGFQAKNPMTGQVVDIPNYIKPVFEPSKKLKEKVNQSNET